MQRAALTIIIATVLAGAALGSHLGRVLADAPAFATPGGLTLAEVKITGDEFLVLRNNSAAAIPDLSVYWLNDYNNVDPLSPGVSSSSEQLPAVSLEPNATLLLSSSSMATCNAAVAGKLTLSLTDGGGFLQLVRDSFTADGMLGQTPVDMVSWSNTDNGVIQSIPTSAKDPEAVYYRYLNGSSYAWQQADLNTANICQLNVVVAGGPVSSSTALTPLALAATSPPATIQEAPEAADASTPAAVPASDIGLLAPQISELLPNPTGTGNDSTKEFIELYNPNNISFDLSGFILQTGLATAHTYAFPAGTVLAARSFHTFYASETGLSLSNSGSQVQLLDPLGRVLGKSDIYGTAKDGVAWALANGKWYWTTSPTPNAANVIKQPPAKAKKSSSAAKKISAPTSGKAAAAGSSSGGTSSLNGASGAAAATTPLHPLVLALVLGAALLYGAYEYRHDLGNRLHQLRANLGARRKHRPAAEGRRGD